jgi:glycosyltransferase involved in cell wall biosynthesis
MNLPAGIRVIMTTDTVGGVWIFATTLARELGAAGFQVLLVTLGPKSTFAQRSTILGCRGVSLIETGLKLEWQDPAGSDFGEARSVLGSVAGRFAPDLVHLNGFREATLDWGVPTIVVAHSCVNSWASACGETESFAGDEWSVYTSSVRAGLLKADEWVAPTAAFRDQLVRQYQLSARGQVIWNGADGNSRPSAPKLPFILSAGRVWDKAKNLRLLASVSADVDWPVRIAGPSGLAGPEIPATAGACEFLGEISHESLRREMMAASIFASPALYEPFGLSVLEAANAGCALVLSDIPTFRELWEGAAIFVDPRDREALTECLRSLCGDEVQRARLQRLAAERARRYPLRQTANAYRSLYTSLLGSHFERSPGIESGEMLA